MKKIISNKLSLYIYFVHSFTRYFSYDQEVNYISSLSMALECRVSEKLLVHKITSLYSEIISYAVNGRLFSFNWLSDTNCNGSSNSDSSLVE